MTDRDQWSLRGPVHTCRLQRSLYSRQCGAEACEVTERIDLSTLEFRVDGFLLRRGHRNPDGSELTSLYEYDNTGRLTTMRTGNGFEPPHYLAYDYDAAGRLERITARLADGSERVTESYEYDAAGCNKKTIYVDPTCQRPDTVYAWTVEGSDSAYSAPGATVLTTFHNENGQPTELLFHGEAGRILSRVAFSYDRNGNLTEEAQTRFAETLPPEMLAALNPAQLATISTLFGTSDEPIGQLHRYNEQNRRVETRTGKSALGGHRKTMAYNDQGDQVVEISENEEREFAIDEEGQLVGDPAAERVNRSEARFLYEYDQHGNWVMKTVESRNRANQEFTPSSVERRTIGYFEIHFEHAKI